MNTKTILPISEARKKIFEMAKKVQKTQKKRVLVQSVKKPKSRTEQGKAVINGGIPSGLLRPIRSAKSAKLHLSYLLKALYTGTVEPVIARTAIYLLSLYLQSIEISLLEERISLLEKSRKEKKFDEKS